ncbi:MAG TPA: tetratricopeptide repeat protein [Desulfobacteria bacterium]|nr:tetratricopeptide repeat protein [Desulfobacteria bacterium]
MNSAGNKIFTMFRISVLTILAALFVSNLLQLNIPTVQEARDGLTLALVERQMELAGENSDNLVQRGWSYYQLGRFTKAKAIMEKAYAEDNSTSALYCLGLIDLKYRRLEDGIAKLEKVLTLSPNHVPTMMALGESYFQQRYYGRSEVLFEKAVQNEPTSAKARLWLGRTYLNTNETSKARQVLSTVNTGPEGREAAALVKNI